MTHGDQLLIGGDYIQYGGRFNLISVSQATGALTSWNPSIAGPFATVTAFGASGNTVFVAGSFTSIGGKLAMDSPHWMPRRLPCCPGILPAGVGLAGGNGQQHVRRRGFHVIRSGGADGARRVRHSGGDRRLLPRWAREHRRRRGCRGATRLGAGADPGRDRSARCRGRTRGATRIRTERDRSRDHPGWNWYDASYSSEAAGSDRFIGTFPGMGSGEYDYCFRYSYYGAIVYADLDGSNNGYSPAQAGALTVTPPLSVSNAIKEIAFAVTGSNPIEGDARFRIDLPTASRCAVVHPRSERPPGGDRRRWRSPRGFPLRDVVGVGTLEYRPRYLLRADECRRAGYRQEARAASIVRASSSTTATSRRRGSRRGGGSSSFDTDDIQHAARHAATTCPNMPRGMLGQTGPTDLPRVS